MKAQCSPEGRKETSCVVGVIEAVKTGDFLLLKHRRHLLDAPKCFWDPIDRTASPTLEVLLDSSPR